MGIYIYIYIYFFLKSVRWKRCEKAPIQNVKKVELKYRLYMKTDIFCFGVQTKLSIVYCLLRGVFSII